MNLMLSISKIFLIILSLFLLLTACGGATTSALAVAGQPTLVFIFTDPWVPWAQMKPIVDGLEQKYGDQVAVKRINALEGDGPAIMQDYKIPGHPVILIFDRQGQEDKRLIGPQPVETIEEVLQVVLER